MLDEIKGEIKINNPVESAANAIAIASRIRFPANVEQEEAEIIHLIKYGVEISGEGAIKAWRNDFNDTRANPGHHRIFQDSPGSADLWEVATPELTLVEIFSIIARMQAENPQLSLSLLSELGFYEQTNISKKKLRILQSPAISKFVELIDEGIEVLEPTILNLCFDHDPGMIPGDLVDSEGELIREGSHRYELIEIFQNNPEAIAQAKLTHRQFEVLKQLLLTYEMTHKSIKHVAEDLGVNRATIYPMMDDIIQKAKENNLYIAYNGRLVPKHSAMHLLHKIHMKYPEYIEQALLTDRQREVVLAALQRNDNDTIRSIYIIATELGIKVSAANELLRRAMSSISTKVSGEKQYSLNNEPIRSDSGRPVLIEIIENLPQLTSLYTDEEIRIIQTLSMLHEGTTDFVHSLESASSELNRSPSAIKSSMNRIINIWKDGKPRYISEENMVIESDSVQPKLIEAFENYGIYFLVELSPAQYKIVVQLAIPDKFGRYKSIPALIREYVEEGTDPIYAESRIREVCRYASRKIGTSLVRDFYHRVELLLERNEALDLGNKEFRQKSIDAMEQIILYVDHGNPSGSERSGFAYSAISEKIGMTEKNLRTLVERINAAHERLLSSGEIDG